MKILHFTPTYSPSIGGIESVVLSLSRQMALSSHEVIVVCLSKNSICDSNATCKTQDNLFTVYYFVFTDLFYISPRHVHECAGYVEARS